MDVDELMEQTGAREHRLFGGRVDRYHLGFAERAVLLAVRAHDGDYRDWDDIADWARGIAAELSAGSPRPVRAPGRPRSRRRSRPRRGAARAHRRRRVRGSLVRSPTSASAGVCGEAWTTARVSRAEWRAVVGAREANRAVLDRHQAMALDQANAEPGQAPESERSDRRVGERAEGRRTECDERDLPAGARERLGDARALAMALEVEHDDRPVAERRAGEHVRGRQRAGERRGIRPRGDHDDVGRASCAFARVGLEPEHELDAEPRELANPPLDQLGEWLLHGQPRDQAHLAAGLVARARARSRDGRARPPRARPRGPRGPRPRRARRAARARGRGRRASPRSPSQGSARRPPGTCGSGGRRRGCSRCIRGSARSRRRARDAARAGRRAARASSRRGRRRRRRAPAHRSRDG